MTDFKEYLSEQNGEPWHAKRSDILKNWSTIRPNMPIVAEAVPVGHKGTRYDFDGIRVTGSVSFISAVMSRIKDLLQYESTPGTKLDVEYRQVATKSGDAKAIPKFAFYVHVVQDIR